MDARQHVEDMEDRFGARWPVGIVATVTIFVLLLSMFALALFSWTQCAGHWNQYSASNPNMLCKSAQLPPTAKWNPTPEAQKEIPANILALYIAAGDRFNVAWPVLAGIGKEECDHARSVLPGCHSGTNFAGAMGPMQFLSGTWSSEMVASPGHTSPSVYDPGDAIFSASNYLFHLGAGGVMDIDSMQVKQAILGYNHSMAYVNSVLSDAHRYGLADSAAAAPGGALGSVARILSSMGPLFSWVPQGGFPGTRFYRGFEDQCTYFAAFQWPGRGGQGVTWSDNAAGWIADARQQGFQVSSGPSVGAIAVWGAQSGYSQFGHVGIVTAVTPNSYTVSEQNYKGAGIIDQRTVPWPDSRSAGFIPVPGGAPSS
jgi:hypothetical protein